MPADDGRDIVIISDLHMSAGYNRRTGTFNRNEDFFYDGAFGRFVDNLLHRATTEARTWRLVLLGDLVDFLQVEAPLEREHGLTSSTSTIAKLEIIARGHPEFFAALGRFIGAGHYVDIVLGNHDIELCWPEVQTRFKALVAEHTQANGHEQMTFHPWIFYVPGVVYAEHGQQYDDVNSFTTLLQPFLPSEPHLIELPLGSFFVLYLFNYIERIDPFADNIRPVTRYLSWALRAHPVVALSTLGYHVRFFIRVLRKTSNLSRDEEQARREDYRRNVLPRYGRALGLPEETIAAINHLAAIPALSNRWRQLRALVFRPLLPTIPAIATAIAIFRAASRLEPGTRSLLTFVAGLAALIWRERRLLRPVTQSGSYLFAAARQIHTELARVGAAVPAYVFGHTHTAEQFLLEDDDNGPRYFNSGTWTPLVPHSFELLSTRERFSFVQITRDPASKDVLARLLVWNDNAERVEPLRLL